MKLATIILNYNSSELVNNLCQFIIDTQLFDEIVVVDNSSSDKEKLSDFEGKVHLIFNEENIGYGPAINKGLRYLSDKNIDYVLNVNNDVLFEKRHVELLVDFMKKHPDYAATSIRMKYKSKLVQNYYLIPTKYNWIFSFNSIPLFAILKRRDTYFETGFVRESFCLFDYKKFEEIGFFDEDFFIYEEGPTIAIRFKKLGYHEAIVGTKNDFYIHNHVGELMSSNAFHKFKDARIKFLKKYYKNSDFAIKLINLFWNFR